MILLIVGVLLGLAIAVGPLQFLHPPVDWVCDQLVHAAQQLLDRALAAAPASVGHAPAAPCVVIILTTALPGLVAMGLVGAARGTAVVRRTASGLALVFAVASFWVLPGWDAFGLLVLVAVSTSAAWLLSGLAITVPAAVLATMLSVRQVVLAHAGHGVRFLRGAQLIHDRLGGPASTWQLVLAAVALAPAVGCAVLALRPASS